MKKLILSVVTTSILAITNYSDASPTLFNNAMVFDNHNFGHIHFDDASQDSYAAIDTYLSAYDAGLSGGDFGGAEFKDSSYSYGMPITQPYGLGGGSGTITLNFNTPVTGVGFFVSGFYNLTTRVRVLVTTADPSSTQYTFTLDEAGLIPERYNINGFFGVMDEEYGISQITYDWGFSIIDRSTIDDFYFGNHLTSGLGDGPLDIVRTEYDTIPLPTLNTAENFFDGSTSEAVPEPASLILFGLALVKFITRRKNS